MVGCTQRELAQLPAPDGWKLDLEETAAARRLRYRRAYGRHRALYQSRGWRRNRVPAAFLYKACDLRVKFNEPIWISHQVGPADFHIGRSENCGICARKAQ